MMPDSRPDHESLNLEQLPSLLESIENIIEFGRKLSPSTDTVDLRLLAGLAFLDLCKLPNAVSRTH